MTRTVRLALILLGTAAALRAQRITGVSPGSDTLTASILLDMRTGQIAKQSVLVTVFGQQITVNMYKSVVLQGGVKVGIPLGTAVTGPGGNPIPGAVQGVGVLIDETGCIFTTATDQAGVQIAGLPVKLVSANPSVLTLANSPKCPSVTVRLADVPIPNPTP